MSEYHISTGNSRRNARSLCGANAANRYKANQDYTVPVQAFEALKRGEIKMHDECIEKLVIIRKGYIEEAAKGTGEFTQTGGVEPEEVLAFIRGETAPKRAALPPVAPPVESKGDAVTEIDHHLSQTEALERIITAQSDAEIDVVFRKIHAQGDFEAATIDSLSARATTRKYVEKFGKK